MEFTVAMAITDFIPVALYLIASIILLKYYETSMSRGQYALYAAGAIDVTAAGGLKALYKLLYAAGVCNFETLSRLQFPLQSIGFLLTGIAVMLYLCRSRKRGTRLSSVEPAFFAGTMLFVGVMVLGLILTDLGLTVEAVRRNRKTAVILLIISCVCSLGMGYLSSREFTRASMNWMAQGVNTLGQLTLLLAAVLLRKAGKAEAAYQA